MNAQKINNSLTAFSSFIQNAMIGGVALLLLGSIIFGTNLSSGNLAAVSWGVIFFYLGSGLIGLSVVGSFLRQTARVIVEGMGGNITEASGKGSGSSSGSKVGKLTNKQYDAWVQAGKPDTNTWDGEPLSFDDWLASRATLKSGE